MTHFTPVEDASSFRRMAAAMWQRPRDPSIYGSMDVDATAALAFLAEHQQRTGARLTITHLVARCVSPALPAPPALNRTVPSRARPAPPDTLAARRRVPPPRHPPP